MDHIELAHAVTEQFKLLTAALHGKYLAHVAPGQEVTPNTLKAYREEATELISAFNIGANNLCANYEVDQSGDPYDEHVWMSPRLTEISKKLNDHGVSIARQLIRKLQHGNPKLLPNATGALAALQARQMLEPNFKLHDAAGRGWTANSLVASDVQDFGYQTMIDYQFARATKDSTKVRVQHPNPNHKFHEKVLTAEEFATQRLVIFHPNSQAWLVPHVLS
jgi:hypothetical protein